MNDKQLYWDGIVPPREWRDMIRESAAVAFASYPPWYQTVIILLNAIDALEKEREAQDA